jgi:tetratricopeptide (TPR) repeat protein
MAEYLWTGKDNLGKTFVKRVNADTPAQAKTLLEERGCSELELHSDDVADAVRTYSDRPAKFSAGEELQIRRKGTTLLGAWSNAFKESKETNILFLLLILFFICTRNYLGAIICAIGFFAFIPIYFWFRQSSKYYRQLNRDRVWYRWDEVLNCIEKLKRAKRWTKIGIPDAEFIRCRASALAGLGRFDEAIAEFSLLAENPKMPRWLYLCQLATIHDIAKKHTEAIALSKQAAELKVDDPIILIDLATRIVRRQKDTVQAKAILDRAEKQTMIELAKPHVPLCRGIIAYYENDYPGAQSKLQEALIGFRPFMRNPIMEGVVLRTKAYLCCVEGSLRNFSEAKRLFRETRKFLEATKEDQLFTECKIAAQEF